jgi:class 3 adenylate cyclase/HAMP domain-containing protein
VASGLVSYLSFRAGQKSVSDLASQLRSELTSRIEGELRGYLTTPHGITQLNATAVAQGELNIANPRNVSQLLQQVKIFPFTWAIYCATQQGEHLTVGRGAVGSSQFNLRQSNRSTGNHLYSYKLDEQGNRQEFIKDNGPYDPRTRPWYQSAVQKNGQTWSDVYLDFTSQLPTVTASQPIYAQSGIVGVCATDVLLPDGFRKFLANLKIGNNGKAFVMDRKGQIISSSTNESLTRGTGKSAKLLQATESSDPLIHETADFLQKQFPDFEQIQQVQQLDYSLHGERQFVQVLPLKDDRGLDWLIVLTVPESDFMGRINANRRNTILLTLAALATAIALGILTSRWITKPILRLTHAADEIASGTLNQHVDLDSSVQIIEVEQLANSFNSMAGQVKDSFDSLETQKNSFARFFPPEYLKFLNKNGITDVALGDHVSKEMAVMFSDIRSFTALSEKMTPQENFDFVNAYLRQVSPEIRAHEGFVVKFLGDGMMAVFPNGVDDAVAAGVNKFKRVQEYNQHRHSEGHLPIDVGMGIHVGQMMVGMVGEDNRIQGDAFSDNVNLTARLEGLTKYYGINLLISGDVVQRLSDPNKYQLRFLDRAIVKGRTEPIEIYEVLDAETEAKRSLKLNTLSIFQAGIQHYRQGDFASAKICFEQILAANPADKTAQLYLERVQQLAVNSPDDWQGVWVFAQK